MASSPSESMAAALEEIKRTYREISDRQVAQANRKAFLALLFGNCPCLLTPNDLKPSGLVTPNELKPSGLVTPNDLKPSGLVTPNDLKLSEERRGLLKASALGDASRFPTVRRRKKRSLLKPVEKMLDDGQESREEAEKPKS